MAATLSTVTLGTGQDTAGSDTLYQAFTKLNTALATLQAALGGTDAVEKPGNYTLALIDAGTVVEMGSSSANTLTIPTHATVALPIGSVIEVCSTGTGVTTIAGATGVTLRGPTDRTIRAQWSSVGLRKRGQNEWVLSGDFT